MVNIIIIIIIIVTNWYKKSDRCQSFGVSYMYVAVNRGGGHCERCDVSAQ